MRCLLSFAVLYVLVRWDNCFLDNFYGVNSNFNGIYNKSLQKCEYIIEKNQLEMFPISKNPQLCSQFNIKETYSMSGKLFVYDAYTIGLVSTNHIAIYLFHLSNSSLVQISKRIFHSSLVPFDACVDKHKHIHVVFPDQYLIAKFRLTIGPKGRIWKLLASLVIPDFSPSAISCIDDHIYLSERPSNEIRVYDCNHNYVKSILVHGVVLSIDKSLSVNSDIRLFIDGLSSVALFQKENKQDDSSQACHFYFHENCIHDVYTFMDTTTYTNHVLITDDCNREIRHYILHKNSKIFKLKGIIKTIGIPTSTIAIDNGFIIIVTYNPRMILVYNLNYCSYSLR